jgi:hypothetical protein
MSRANSLQDLIITPKVLSRFWGQVSKYGGHGNGFCWFWTGSKNLSHKKEYGMFFVKDKSILAHRFSYLLHNGTIDTSLVIDHICDNGLCVNPTHLQQITNRENILKGNGTSAMHHKATHCAKGHLLDRKKHLTVNGVRTFRSRYCYQCKHDYMTKYRKRKREEK